jgi:hypothetical protein
MTMVDKQNDRDRGVLSKTDRRYLRGETDYSPKVERNRRTEIRKRIKNGIEDFSVISECLEERDRKQVFDESDDPASIKRGMVDAMYFFYLGTLDTRMKFSELVEEAAESAEYDYHVQRMGETAAVDADFEITVDERGEIDGMVERLRSEDPITFRELMILYTASKERGERVNINKVVLKNDDSILASFDDETIRERFLDDLLENWGCPPATVALERME